jgi:murein DD-endopeptidase MepM/ murein hydrolase activator NlpD
MTTYETPHTRQGFDGLAFVAFVLIALGGLVIFRDVSSRNTELAIVQDVDTGTGSIVPLQESAEVGSGREISPNVVDDSMFVSPYKEYTLTQGPHGFSYGHMAIDIAAGKDAKIKSPIHGEVTELYVDEYGNPTLVIENDIYQVTMLHGKYKVAVGDQLELGQMVGRESNLGYTTDINGRPCWNRECGYHTHLNVFDKRIGSNVNPILLIGN